MPSESAKRRKEKKKSQAKGKPGSSASKNQAEQAVNGASNGETSLNGELKNLKLSERSCTGVLASHPEARDLHIQQFSITFHGVEILVDSKLELNCHRRYGLIGLNGCGRLRILQPLFIDVIMLFINLFNDNVDRPRIHFSVHNIKWILSPNPLMSMDKNGFFSSWPKIWG